jgi:cell wall-associated NlpC family hydrolase
MKPGLRRLAVCLAVTSSAAALAVATGFSADAAAPGPHDPFGNVAPPTVVTGGLHFTGWAIDPDARTSNVKITAVLDGRTYVASVMTSVASATLTSRYNAGPTPGFSITAPVGTGAHTVCIVASTIGAGLSTVLTCATTPLGVALTSSQVAAHNPHGAILTSSAGSASLRLTGWASDPDWISRHSTVVLYVDGVSTATVVTSPYPAPRPSDAGYASAFDITVPVARGTHIGCIWAVNVGLGSNKFLGCRARDTRGAAGTGTITVPTLNTQALTEAKKHIGQQYVWGAAGPTTFDCSGLVKYSYGKFGYTTPRVSEAQAVSARLIPASRAVPGDLVFTHDTEGDVYHVGLYVSPGKAFAAIDEVSDVNYQTIWDPANTTYGSFTHT